MPGCGRGPEAGRWCSRRPTSSTFCSPVDRGAALRGLAIRRLRTGAFAGTVGGLIAANFAFRRLPGHPGVWLLCGAVFGAAVAVAGLSSAMIASGRRLPRAAASLLAVLIIGWSVADLLGHRVTSPASMLGELALWPLPRAGDSFALPAAGLVAVALAAVLGLAGLAGTSLEEARRRAGLAAELRFAVTMQDIRATILLRRQLAAETPRSRPWLRPRPGDGADRAIWQRDWQSFLRWPAVRVARVCVLGAVAGLSLLGTWNGTTPLVLVAALALLVAAFDAIEPLGQEVDHPTRLTLLPVSARDVTRRHLVAPVVLMGGVSVIAIAAAVAAGAPGELVGVLIATAAPMAVVALCCAALSVTNDPFAYVLSPAMGYVQTGLPVVLVIIGVSGPMLVAREAARHGQLAIGAVIGAEIPVLLICAGIVAGLLYRITKRYPVRA